MANRRVHGTTHQDVGARWDADQFALQPIAGRPPYSYVDDELRKVARDAYVAWQSNRYSVPWQYAGRQVWVRDRDGSVEVHWGGERIVCHDRANGRHQGLTRPEHHCGIPLGANGRGGKILVHLVETAPEVEARPLAAYEAVLGGAR